MHRRGARGAEHNYSLIRGRREPDMATTKNVITPNGVNIEVRRVYDTLEFEAISGDYSVEFHVKKFKINLWYISTNATIDDEDEGLIFVSYDFVDKIEYDKARTDLSPVSYAAMRLISQLFNNKYNEYERLEILKLTNGIVAYLEQMKIDSKLR